MDLTSTTKTKEYNFKFIKPGEVRTRFAPSPTGFLHIGSTRTALFNFLFTKKYQGRFILRIEDTDPLRSKPKFEENIIESLKWLGIEWDEGPAPISQREIGEFPISLDAHRRTPRRVAFQFPKERNYIGNYGPYRQSERRDIYAKYLEKLLKDGKAYYCFCSEEELEARRQEQMSRGEPPQYDGRCAKLSSETIKKKLAEGKPSIIRFKVPTKKISFNDMIRGKIEFDTNLLGDIPIAKDLATPLYNFAVVVDDFEMKISHVIRGEDLLPNTPKQILLQEALNFPKVQYGHLPLILGPDRSKLSKRHGATAVSDYRKTGYLPETIINFLAFLGWNPGTEREIYSLASLIKEFSISRVQKSAAIFNIKRLDFLNGFYLRQKSPEKLTELCISYLIREGLIEPIFKSKNYPPAYGGMSITQEYRIVETKEEVTLDYLKEIVFIYQERLKKLSEIIELTDFFFKDKLEYEKQLLYWKDTTNEEVVFSLDKLIEILSKIKKDDWNKENLENILILEAERIGDRGKILWPLRAAVTGKEASAGPFDITGILGKEKTLKRLREARELLLINKKI